MAGRPLARRPLQSTTLRRGVRRDGRCGPRPVLRARARESPPCARRPSGSRRPGHRPGPRGGRGRPARPGWPRTREPRPGRRWAGQSPGRPAGTSRTSPYGIARSARHTCCSNAVPPTSIGGASPVGRGELTADRRDVGAQGRVRRGQIGARELGGEIGFERRRIVAQHHPAHAALGGGDQQLAERRRRDDGADALAGAAATVGAGRHAEMAAGLFVDCAARIRSRRRRWQWSRALLASDERAGGRPAARRYRPSATRRTSAGRRAANGTG